MNTSESPVVVMKFGGTSVGDISRIKRVADLVAAFRQSAPGVRIVVVLSAMAGETNRLVRLAKECVDRPQPREMDVLLATGEQVTIALLAMRLCEMGISAKSLLAPQVRISTDARHTNAQIESIDSRVIEDIVAAGAIPIVAGFQGISEEGDITTLGRGGSDITAVALAAALRARTCYIYTDVSGVFSTDPRLDPKARLLEQVSHEEMLEMASLGAKVLHPRSVYFAMRYGVPLAVLSTFNPTRKTWIVKESELMEKPVVTGVTYRLDDIKVTVSGMPTGGDALSTLFTELADADVFIDVITQSEAWGIG